MRIFLFTLIRTFVCQEPTLFLCYSTCGTLQTDLCFLCSEQFSDGLLYPFQKIIPDPSATLQDNLPEVSTQPKLTMNPTVVDKLQTWLQEKVMTKRGKRQKKLNFRIFVILILSSHVWLLTTKTLGNTDSEKFGMIGVFEDERGLVNETQLKDDTIDVEGGISYEFEDNITDSDIYDDISRNVEHFDGLANITDCSCCMCSSFQVSENIWYKIEVVLDLRYLVFCVLGASVAVFIYVAVKKLSHARKQLRLWRLTGRTDLRYVNRRNANVKVQCVNEKGWMN